MGEKHFFDIEVAKTIGLTESIIINNIHYVLYNYIVPQRKNFYKNNFWIKTSIKALSNVHSYLSERQVNYSIAKLIEDGYLLKDNFSKNRYDHTSYYALTEKCLKLLNSPILSILQNCEIEIQNLSNRKNEIVKSNIIDYNNRINNKKESLKKSKNDFLLTANKNVYSDDEIQSFTDNWNNIDL